MNGEVIKLYGTEIDIIRTDFIDNKNTSMM